MFRMFLTILLLIITGCITTKNQTDDPKTESMEKRTINRSYNVLCEANDLNFLKKWVEKPEANGKMLQIPVLIKAYSNNPFQSRIYQLGHQILENGDALKFKIDDTRMGISLDDHLRTDCEKEADLCKFWIEGVVEIGRDTNMEKKTDISLHVSAYGYKKYDDKDSAGLHVWIEK